MTSWTWLGSRRGSTDWFQTANWSGGTPYPQPGDSVTIDVSPVLSPTLSPSDPGGGTLDNLQVTLLNNSITSAGTAFGPGFALAAGGGGHTVVLGLSGGPVTYAGSIGVVGQFRILAVPPATDAAFSLTASATVTLSSRSFLLANLGPTGTFANDGAIEVGQGAGFSLVQGALTGTGRIDVGTAASAYLIGTVAPGQTVALNGPGATLIIAGSGGFGGRSRGSKPATSCRSGRSTPTVPPTMRRPVS